MNLLNFLGGKMDQGMEIRVFTRKPPPGIAEYSSKTPGIRLVRYENRSGQPAFKRYRDYGKFYFSTTWKLAAWKPDTVLYYETLSSIPAIFYNKFFKRGARLLVHYHEYESPAEHKKQMKIGRWGHSLEKSMYPSYCWVSHTNEDRMRLFLDDNREIKIPNTHILPNYPPGNWQSTGNPRHQQGLPVKFVYIGSLSLDTMFAKEFAGWIQNQKGNASWDIYSHNREADLEEYFSSLGNKDIRFHGGVNYFSLPDILKDYDVGLILYKGHIPNYVYNTPNKLFEYFACGLDIWLPQGMISCLGLLTTNTYPKIIAVDFEKLEQEDLNAAIDHRGLMYKPSIYHAEERYDYFLKNGLMV
jgi:hypothetical protein